MIFLHGGIGTYICISFFNVSELLLLRQPDFSKLLIRAASGLQKQRPGEDKGKAIGTEGQHYPQYFSSNPLTITYCGIYYMTTACAIFGTTSERTFDIRSDDCVIYDCSWVAVLANLLPFWQLSATQTNLAHAYNRVSLLAYSASNQLFVYSEFRIVAKIYDAQANTVRRTWKI